MSAIARVKADVNELKNITDEINRLNAMLKPLRQRKKQIEEQILQFMERTGNNGLQQIKMNNVELVSVEKKHRERLRKEDKEKSAIELLQQSGIANARRVFNDLKDVMKGQETTTHVLKVKDNQRVLPPGYTRR